MDKHFKIKLKQHHDKTGLSGYAVSKATGVAENTARKYISQDEIFSETIPLTVIYLCDFYGVDWRSPEIIEVVEKESEGDESPEAKTPLPATA